MINEKHHVLYNYLLEKGDVWTSQVEVARDLYAEFGNGECCLAPEEYHDSSERLILSKTISEINLSSDFEKIIISGKRGVKIANKEEHHKYVVRQYAAVLRKLKRIYIMERKGNANGQISLDGRTIEAFLNGVNAEANIF